MMVLPKGTRWIPGHFDHNQQRDLLKEIRQIAKISPLFIPKMPKTGKEMSVRMTNCGELGWVTDKENGYRYQAAHPVTNQKWPAIPDTLLELWDALSGFEKPPQACLINFYDVKAKMGLHQDRDEEDFGAPVISVSLGDDCLFRIGGQNGRDKTSSMRLASGDVVIMGGESRLAFHGVDRVYPDTSALLKQGGRINLTLRRVTA